MVCFKKLVRKRLFRFHSLSPLDDYIESYHPRSGFSRERMGTEQAAAFDREAKETLLHLYTDGTIPLQVATSVVWGIPQDHSSGEKVVVAC